MRKIVLFAVMCLGAYAQVAEASFIKTDWQVAGDQKAVLDSTTGIEWLNLTQTNGLSVNQVISQLDTTFKGWRLPTPQEVSQLLHNIWGVNMNINAIESRSGAYRNGANAFGNLLSSGAGHLSHHRGFYINDAGVVKMAGSYMNEGGAYTWSYGMSNTEVHSYTSTSIPNVHSIRGVFLVSDGGVTLSSINDPSLNINNPNAPINNVFSPVSIGSALFALLFMRRRFVGK